MTGETNDRRAPAAGNGPWRLVRGLPRPAALGAILAALAPLSGALTLNLSFDAANSDAPSFDPDGSLLVPIMEAVADVWEDIIEDPWTINVTYRYDDLSDTSGTLASHTNQGTSQGKPTNALVRFDTRINGSPRNWFFDSTPTDHGEFDLQQTLYRDLGPTDQADWYVGAVPGVLEAGYRGRAVAGPAIGAFDLFSSAAHELGHAVGLTGAVASGEYADDDYDVNPAFVGGATMAVGANGAHVLPRLTLMCGGCGALSRRRMVSATDVLAVAAASDWLLLDLPRKDFVAGAAWSPDGNWIGGAAPGGADEVALRHGGSVSLAADGDAGTLLIDGQAGTTSLDVAAGTLRVTDRIDLALGGQLTVGDALRVGTAGTALATGGAAILGGAQAAALAIDSGTLTVAAGLLVGEDSAAAVTQTGGSVQVGAGLTLGSAAAGDGTYLLQGGTLDLAGTGIAIGAGTGGFQITGGTLADAGSIGFDLVNDGGVLSPGSPVGVASGVTSIGGDYTQNGGALAIEIGGTAQGAEHDHLAVTGDVLLGGVLDVTLIGGFQPTAGDAFTILTAAGITGAFAAVNLPDPGGILAFELLENPASLLLRVNALLLPGDANNDGAVTDDDLIAIQQHYGDIGPNLDGTDLGDANDDGAVTADDLVAVQQFFGTVLSPPAAAAATPEPSTIAVIALCPLVGSRSRYRSSEAA